MEFEAHKDKHGKLFIKPNFEKKSNGDVICHMPTLQMINKFEKENNGKRNL